jgi:ADP-ribosylglycohydrolase
MRAGPVGVLAGTPAELVRAAVDQARVTHRDPRCAAGAVAVAGAVALAGRHGPLDRTAFISSLVEMVQAVDDGFAAEIGGLPAWSDQPPPVALRLLRRRGLVEGRGPWRGMPVNVVPSVLWSLYAFLRTPDDYWEAVCTAIWVGGDTDTTGAMTGAISGARLGAGALPGGLIDALNDGGAWRAEALAALAAECVGIEVF